MQDVEHRAVEVRGRRIDDREGKKRVVVVFRMPTGLLSPEEAGDYCDRCWDGTGTTDERPSRYEGGQTTRSSPCTPSVPSAGSWRRGTTGGAVAVSGGRSRRSSTSAELDWSGSA